MKKLLTLTIVMLALCTATSAMATIDWAGNVWPLAGSNQVPTGPLDVYAQVYKAGVTDAAGQGADISAVLYYTTDIAPQVMVAMGYNGDVGNNDEYTAAVPQAALVGATYVDVTVIFTDETDQTTFEVTGDQSGNPPPIRYNIVNVLPNDVTVHFTMCMSGEVTAGPPCVIGSADEIGAWGAGVIMNYVSGDLWEIDVTFAAGINPSFEYKYKKDGCLIWEDVPNRAVTLPTDGTTDVVLDVDSWNNLPLGCGLGSVLEEEKVLCIQVCMAGVDYSGGVCVTGNQDELTNWGDGAAMTLIGPDLYQACFIYPQGTAIPVNLEFKFKKDDCQTWESVANRLFSVDNTLPAETDLTFSWDDTGGECAPVATQKETWGTLKGLYR